MRAIRSLLLTGALISANAYAAPACPGGASWCEDFERGVDRWEGRVEPVRQADAPNRLLRLQGTEGAPTLLVRQSDSAGHTNGAYFVEARLRALPATETGQSYLIARYADERNWLALALDAGREAGRVNVAMVRMQDGKLETFKRGSAAVKGKDSFVTLRLDVDGELLTMYINGNRIVGASAAAMPPARVGLHAAGGGFEVDDLRIGSTRVPPSRFGLAGFGQNLELQQGDGPRRFQVRSVTGATVGAPAVRAVSSDPGIAAVEVDGASIVVTPKRSGQALLTVSSATDNNLALTIDTKVGQAFAASARALRLDGRVEPASGARDVPVDTLLRLRFDAAPQLGQGGSVRIHRASDGALVDVIRLGDEANVIGTAGDGVRRVVRYSPIEVDGAGVTIRPHNGRLAYDTAYYVLVDGNLFGAATLAGQPFDGIGKAARWTFRTRARAPAADVLKVDDDGPADFRTVQGALDHAMRSYPREKPVTIQVANGRYGDLLYLRGKDKLTLRGESRDGVVIAVRNSDGLNPGAGSGQAEGAPGLNGGRAVFLVEDADMLHLDRLTMINTTHRDKPLGGQAETINFTGEGRLMATDASFFSEQDTIRVEGWSWFYRSLVAGNVDFIWGPNHAALFEQSEIRTLGNGNKGGYIVQARTLDADDPGYVFLDSRITHGPGPTGDPVPPGSATLARPGTANTWDKVSFINCRIGPHIAQAGWTGVPRDGTGWFEFNSMDMDGKPLDTAARKGGLVLSAAQATRFSSRERVFAGYGKGKGWNPVPDAAQGLPAQANRQ